MRGNGITSGAAAHLVSMQEPSGCFPSLVTRSHRSLTDHNGFATAMVLRTLRGMPDESTLAGVRSRALHFLERCRSTRIPGAFGFWPEDLRPSWASKVPADADDTAIMTVELLKHGRLSPHDGLRTVCHVLIPRRIHPGAGQPLPPWISAGAFPTWLGAGGAANVVDCCVNANVAALMALIGATHLPGFQEAVNTIVSGIAWAESRPERLRWLTPFYPSVHDLQDAVAHAVDCGAEPLRSALDQLRDIAGDRAADDQSACCCSAYGATVWRCRALEEARALCGAGSRSGSCAWPDWIISS